MLGRRLGIMACALVGLWAGGLRADTVQPVGPIAAIRYHSTASDDYTTFQASVQVGDSVGGYVTYRIGGSSCPNANFDIDEIALLQRAMNNPRILIEPRTKVGQGGNLCLVAFTLVLRSELGALP